MIDSQNTEKKINWTTHLFLVACLSFFGVFAVWAYYGELDIVSVAGGRVVTRSKVKEIQHLEGGIISEILVAEGAKVVVDQPLFILEDVRSDSTVRELEMRIAAYAADIIRLEAMIEGQVKPSFTGEKWQKFTKLARQTRGLYEANMNRYKSELISQRELIEQRGQEIKGIEFRISNNRTGLSLLQRQIAISSELLKDELTTEYKHLSFLREEASLKSKVEEDGAMLKRADSLLVEAKERLKRIKHAFREKASEELKDARQGRDEYVQRMKKYQDSQRRSVIRSPVDGVVKTLYIFTVGGVVTAGKTIMDIVPSGDNLLVEAHLAIQDIGFITVGQKAVVKLASRDARRFGKLEGEVISISPDAMASPDGQTFYTARVKTEKNYFEWGSDKYEFIPGMAVVVSIHTGKRSVLAYILDPFIDSMGYSLQER